MFKSKRQLMFDAQDGRCYYCNIEMFIPPKKKKLRRVKQYWRAATFEHLHRRCNGGSNKAENIVLACHGCNGARDYHSPTVWGNADFRNRVDRYRRFRKTSNIRRRKTSVRIRRYVLRSIEKLDSMVSHLWLTLTSKSV